MEEHEISRQSTTRKSKRKSRIGSFISHFKSEGNSDGFISPPTNFEKKVFTNESFSPHLSIQECPFDVTGYGCLIMKDKFELKLTVQKKRKKNVVVFMFERIIVFTTEKEKDSFYYLGSINISDLSIAPPSKPTKLLLTDFKKSKITNSNVEYTLKSKNKELIFAWRNAIQNSLWKEITRLKGFMAFNKSLSSEVYYPVCDRLIQVYESDYLTYFYCNKCTFLSLINYY